MDNKKFDVDQLGAFIGFCCVVVILMAILNSMTQHHAKVASPAVPSSSVAQ